MKRRNFALLVIPLALALFPRSYDRDEDEGRPNTTLDEHRTGTPSTVTTDGGSTAPSQTPSTPSLSKQQAVLCALNKIAETPDGVALEHPLHTARFGTDGIEFTPVASGQAWGWSLRHFGSRKANLIPAARAGRRPERVGLRSLAYRYGAFTEVYHARQEAVEQQFVLHQPLPQLDGADLVVRGEIASDGGFEEYPGQWQWRDGRSGAVVSLGDVTVFDAQGAVIPATMEVGEGRTEIVVDGPQLAAASYPVTIDPMIGTDDFLISSSWLEGARGLLAPAAAEVCYNSDTGLFLVAWLGVTEDRERVVLGRHINAAGAPVGDVIRIGEGGDSIFGDPSEYENWALDLVYNPDRGEYLIVWQDARPDGDNQILGQTLNTFGQPVGGNSFLHVGDSARLPSVAYNPRSLRYMVAWMEGDRSLALLTEAIGGGGIALFDAAPSLSSTSSNHVAPEPAGDGFIFALGGKATPAGTWALFTQRVDADGTPRSLFPTPVRDSGVATAQSIRSVEIEGSAATGGFAVAWIEPQPAGGDLAKVALLDATSAGIPDRTVTVGDGSGPVRIAAAADGASYLVGASAPGGATQLTAVDATSAGTTPGGELGPDTHFVSVQPTAGQALVAFVQIAPLADAPEHAFPEVHAATAPLSALANSPLDWEPVSDSLPTTDSDVYALDPDVAYDHINDRHAVVWSALTLSGGSRIWQQIVHADGSLLPADVPHSAPGPPENPYHAASPKVAFNSRDDEFLIVWTGSNALTSGEFEVFAARVADGGVCVVTRRVSDSGNRHVAAPDLAYSHEDNRFLVVWLGQPNTDNVDLIGRLLRGDSFPIGGVFRITQSGLDHVPDRDAKHFDLAYSAQSQQYTIAYSARNPLPDGGGVERDGVFLQGVNRDGARTAPFAQALDLSADPNARVAIANRPDPDGFLVAWDGGDSGSDRIRAQHLGGLSGNLLPPDGNRIIVSTFPTEDAFNPDVEWNGVRGEFLVTWATDRTAAVGSQVIARPVQAQGTYYGAPMVLSATDALDFFTGEFEGAGLVAHDADGDYLAVWSGITDSALFADANSEVFGQRFATEDLPFTITSIIREGDDIIGSFTLMPGLDYQVQMSTDMQTWTNLGPVRISQPGGNNAFFQEGVLRTAGQRFYRVVRPAP